MATKINIDGYNSYSGTDIVVTAQLSQINGSDKLSKKCYVLGSLQTISISTYQDKSPVRAIGNINAKDYLMGPRSIAGSLVFAVFDRHFAYDIFNDLKEFSGKGVLLTDEIPALDITICFSNEYGKKSKMVLYGVKMISEGQVMSINDLFTENTYQFVGTGLENLTPEDSVYPSFTSSSKKQDVYIESSDIPFDDVDLSGMGSKFSYTGDKYNQDYFGKSDNFSYIEINQPLTDDDYGTIIVALNNPNAIELKLTNKYLTDENPIEYFYNAGLFNNNNIWSLNVPQGNYNLICIDKETQEELEVIENINVYYSNEIIDLNDYPLIDSISDTSIKATINNPEHDTLVIALDNTIIESQKTDNNKQYIFENLLPDTKYIIYSINSNNDEQSKKSSCTTLLKPTQLKEDFKSFIENNKNLWINDLSEFNYDALFENNNTDYNLINKIIKNASEDIKYELLIYAIKYQNSLSKSVNSDNRINQIINDNLLEPSFNIKDNYDYLNFYYTNNDKEYYATSKSSYDTDFIFNDFYNKHLFVYAIDSNKLKSLRYDFYTFNDLENKLEDYRYKTINYNDYNYNLYKNKNANFDENLLEAIVLKENNSPSLSLLKAPYVSYDINKQTLYINLDYEGLLDNDKKYYLCISSKNDIFQHLPINKILLSDVFEFTLDKYHSHILKDNYYFIYIENEEYKIISDTSIISTYPDDSNLTNYNYSNVKKELIEFKNTLIDKYNCSDLIETTYLSSISNEDIFTKNIHNIFRQELLNEGINSIQYSNLDSVFFDSIVNNYDSYVYSAIVNYDNNTKELTFYDNNFNLIILDFYTDEDYPVKTLIENNNVINLNKDSYYTVVYGINKNTKQKTGFFLKNNVMNKIYLYKLLLKEDM